MRLVLLGILASFHTIFGGQQTLSCKAERVLDSIAYELPAPSIIGKHEWKELQLDRLVTMLDRTTTSFGRWGLVQLLHPIADKEELLRRREIITFLIEHEDEMRVFQEQLKHVYELEKSLLSYWDEDDQLNSNVRQFYYTFSGLKNLNKNSLALNASTVMEMFNSWKYLIGTLAFGGITVEYNNWFYGGKEFSLWRGIKNGLQVPLMQHSFARSDALKDADNRPYGLRDVMIAVGAGSSLGDRIYMYQKRYTTPPQQFWIWFFKWILVYDKPETTYPGFNNFFSFVFAAVPTVFQDYQWGSAVVSTSKHIISMYRTLDKLQNRVADIAQCIDAIEKLQTIVANQAPELSLSIQNTGDGYVLKRKKLLKNLLAPRFLHKSDYLYSRGHVLTMHLELMKQKKTLVPLLQSVALLDAYCSIAQLYKENQNKHVTFTFPEFVDAEKPFLSYRAAWLPLLPQEQAVTNDLFLGAHESGKMIITGPNGSGKSTILKTLGIMPILAQSGFPVPAQQAQQTLFTSIVTNFAPREDLQRNLSTGMAGIKAMDEVRQAISTSGGELVLVLIDEPYGGMVDAEAAKRIYLFGKDIAQHSNVLVSIATHTKRPMQLAQDTAGVFANYQVKINEIRDGEFERLFKLEKGPALWWFENEEMRSRFVDWLALVSNKNSSFYLTE